MHFWVKKQYKNSKNFKQCCDPDNLLESDLFRRCLDNHLTEKYDLIVIGGGPAGEKGASKAAYYGKRVALVERAPYLGGAGINTGTVPSKTLRESALYFSGLQQRGLYGIDYSFKKNLSIKDFMYRERTVVDNEREMIEKTVRRHNISRHPRGRLAKRCPHSACEITK